jgi:hypothetical protein
MCYFFFTLLLKSSVPLRLCAPPPPSATGRRIALSELLARRAEKELFRRVFL